MTKFIHVHIKDNDDKNFEYIHATHVSAEEYETLKNYDAEDYDMVWDRLCERIDRVMPASRPDWYIDTIDLSVHKLHRLV